nr:hypothetical protein KitaXyl93_11580 [Kitasatospora sp. Xyl93]
MMRRRPMRDCGSTGTPRREFRRAVSAGAVRMPGKSDRMTPRTDFVAAPTRPATGTAGSRRRSGGAGAGPARRERTATERSPARGWPDGGHPRKLGLDLIGELA